MTAFRTAGGDVLTDEIVEELADEAERGYDLSKATKVTYGRPSLGAAGVSRACRSEWTQTWPTRARRARMRSIAPSARSPVRRYAKT